MSAYLIVELTVRDAEAKNRYAAAAEPIVKSFGGEFLINGPITTLFGEAQFSNALIVRFADRESAISFYNAPIYQALLEERALGIDCRFSLLG